MSDDELIRGLEKLKSVMVSVSTGGSRIEQVNSDYQALYGDVESALREREIENLNAYRDLWEWYGRWSSGDLPSYQSRRQFLGEMFNPMLQKITDRAAGRSVGVKVELTGWPKVDRTIGEIRRV